VSDPFSSSSSSSYLWGLHLVNCIKKVAGFGCGQSGEQAQGLGFNISAAATHPIALIHFRQYLPQRGGYKKWHRNPFPGINQGIKADNHDHRQIKCPTLMYGMITVLSFYFIFKYQEPTVL